MKLNRIFIAFVLIFFCAVFANAQTQTETPEQFTERYIAATKVGDWAGVAQMLHPEAREQFKKMFSDLVADDKIGAVIRGFFKVKTKQEYDALSPDAVFVRLMQTLSSNEPVFSKALENSRIKIIGHIKEEPDLVYVVYRTETNVEGASFSQLDVMQLRKHQESWRALLTGNIENLTQMLPNLQNDPPPAPARKTPPKKRRGR